jgi:hypothetical protein
MFNANIQNPRTNRHHQTQAIRDPPSAICTSSRKSNIPNNHCRATSMAFLQDHISNDRVRVGAGRHACHVQTNTSSPEQAPSLLIMRVELSTLQGYRLWHLIVNKSFSRCVWRQCRHDNKFINCAVLTSGQPRKALNHEKYIDDSLLSPKETNNTTCVLGFCGSGWTPDGEMPCEPGNGQAQSLHLWLEMEIPLACRGRFDICICMVTRCQKDDCSIRHGCSWINSVRQDSKC